MHFNGNVKILNPAPNNPQMLYTKNVIHHRVAMEPYSSPALILTWVDHKNLQPDTSAARLRTNPMFPLMAQMAPEPEIDQTTSSLYQSACWNRQIPALSYETTIHSLHYTLTSKSTRVSTLLWSLGNRFYDFLGTMRLWLTKNARGLPGSNCVVVPWTAWLIFLYSFKMIYKWFWVGL